MNSYGSLLDIKEAAAMMGMSASWLYKKVAARTKGNKVDIPQYIRLSNKILFRQSDILVFLSSKVCPKH